MKETSFAMPGVGDTRYLPSSMLSKNQLDPLRAVTIVAGPDEVVVIYL
jgi:hypothetical protein